MTGDDAMPDREGLFIEETIINAVKRLLAGRVNEILGEVAWPVLPIEFEDNPATGYAITPEIRLAECERTEKERLICLEIYSMTIGFSFPEQNGELHCYAYASAVGRALREDPTMGGSVDRAVLVKKEYRPPKHPRCGEHWEVVLTLRFALEGIGP
jgi:hypothetical protein